MENKNLDIYSWILSPKIREAWRREPLLPLLEQAELIYPAFRSVEDKLSAIACLYAMAETEEEKESLGQAVQFYETAIRQMKGEDRKKGQERKKGKGTEAGANEWGEIWMAVCCDYDMAREAHPYHMNYFEEPHLFYSYEAAREWAAQYVTEGFECCVMQKWVCGKAKPEEALECTLRVVDGILCATHVYMDNDGLLDFDQNRHLPYRLPFSTGDLVKLEGPVFSEPIFGVWCGELGADGIWYNWMGYREKEEGEKEPFFSVQSMTYHRLQAYELSVLDWLCPADREELPEEERTLGEIADSILQIREREGEKAAVRSFWKVFRIGR